MARRVAKSAKSKKTASPAKKAAKAGAPKKAAKGAKSGSKGSLKQSKRTASKKPSSKKAAAKKAAPKKKASPRAPAKKVAKPVKKAARSSTKKAAQPVHSTPVRKTKKTKARPAAKPAAKKLTRKRVAPPPKPRASKPSPAELEALRIAKELRQAQERQLENYDKAIKTFNARRFQRALTLFEKVAEGPDSTFGDRARIHIQICRRQTQARKVKFKTADELYNYSIRLINERRFQEAGRNIAQALKMQPRAAHIHFAAAVVGALTQDTDSTYKSLKRAIELDPRNRVLALNDADLASVADEPAIAKLLHGDR